MFHRLAGLVVVSLCSPLLAQDSAKWFELKDFGPVTRRLAVTVQNPADVPVEAALVHLPLKDLQGALPDAKEARLCVVDPAAKPARRDAADQNFVPFQISHDKEKDNR